MNIAEEPERAQLLVRSEGEEADANDTTTPPPDSPPSPSNTTPSPDDAVHEGTIVRFLPIAFTAAFAIAATSATTIYAYAGIVCADPVRCRDEEQDRYAGIVALATTVANLFILLAVGVLRTCFSSCSSASTTS